MNATLARFASALVLVLAPALPVAAEPPVKVVMLSGSEEYESDRTLDAFAAWLGANYHAEPIVLKAAGTTELTGTAQLDAADVALFFTRRLTLDAATLGPIKTYCEAGKPIVAVRTASHGFQNWLEFDKEYLGGNYHGHHGRDLLTVAKAIDPSHPLLAGVGALRSRSSLYKTDPLAADCAPLLEGSTGEASHPLAWSRERPNRQRIVYTSLGGPGDFGNAAFRRLLVNALGWTGNKPLVAKLPAPVTFRPPTDRELTLLLRKRIVAPAGDVKQVEHFQRMSASKTALLICDMWDQHWCPDATRRGDEIAKRLAEVVVAAREAGIQIIHCPSDCMSYYEDTPQRRRMRNLPAAAPPPAAAIADPPLPIDDSDGGCDSPDARESIAWTSQNPRIPIGEHDGITDDGREVYNLLRHLGIEDLIITGVHTNMCVLNRSFGIKQMTRNGVRCVLVRDLTDTMYDPKDRPFVAHERGTELVVEHIERHWAHSTTSEQLLSGIGGR